MKIILASFITLTAVFMAAVAAWDRGGTMADKLLLICMSVVIVLAVHFLPSLSKRPAMWVVWFVCLIGAIYGHLTFLTHASLRAGAAQSQETVKHIGLERQIQIIEESLAKIEARPVSIVAAELSKSTSKREKSALNLELAESKKAGALRDQLIVLSGASTESQILESSDPVVSKLAGFFEVKDSVIYVTIGLVFSILIEVIGALVWFEVLRVPTKNEVGSHVSSHVTQAVTTPIVTHKNNELDINEGNAVTSVTGENSHVTLVTPGVSSHVTDRDSKQAAPSVLKVVQDVIKPAADQVKAGPGVSPEKSIPAKPKKPLGIEGLVYTNAVYCYPAIAGNVVCYTEPRKN